MFLQQLFHRRHVQHLIGDDPFELGVLSSNSRTRFASDGSMPPNFFRQA
jgi:hypothetical protein